MFTGLSAFPLTPFKDESIDFTALAKLITNLAEANVDSICAMGSTGLYPYLTRDEKYQVVEKTVEHAGEIPVMAGIGALRTLDVLKNAEAVQKAGAQAVLLAPVSYHPLHENEVYALYEKVTAELSVPLCVYENPGVTHFVFSDTLYQEVAKLPQVGAIKIPGMPFANEQGAQRLSQLRSLVPETVAIGVSGDKFGAAGMVAGCDLWLSVIGGLFPKTVKRLISLTQSEQGDLAVKASQNLNGIWELFARNKGGMRVMATAAGILGYSEGNCLPAPLLPLGTEDKATLTRLLNQLELD